MTKFMEKWFDSVHSARDFHLAEWTLWIKPECPALVLRSLRTEKPLNIQGVFQSAAVSELGLDTLDWSRVSIQLGENPLLNGHCQMVMPTRVGHSGSIRSVHWTRVLDFSATCAFILLLRSDLGGGAPFTCSCCFFWSRAGHSGSIRSVHSTRVLDFSATCVFIWLLRSDLGWVGILLSNKWINFNSKLTQT